MLDGVPVLSNLVAPEFFVGKTQNAYFMATNGYIQSIEAAPIDSDYPYRFIKIGIDLFT